MWDNEGAYHELVRTLVAGHARGCRPVETHASSQRLVKVQATAMPKPALHLWNGPRQGSRGSEPDPRLWVGGRLMEGMQPHAHRYGGHQFGNWAHQLGDGRALTLGHVDAVSGPIEVQLKGLGAHRIHGAVTVVPSCALAS